MSVSSLRIAAALAASAAVAAASLIVGAEGVHGNGEAFRHTGAANDEIALDVEPPPRLSGTGFFAGPASDAPGADVLPFAPQYPLWSDGATKRRWIYLPKGTVIDASAPTEWRFPVGTKLWKEFSFGTAVETRYSERLADGRWVLATYVSDADHQDATLAPTRGIRGVREIAPGVRHDIPGRLDCLACHGGRATPVLGFNALDLSPDRDPLAAHAEAVPAGGIDLAWLIATGRLRNAPAAWTSTPPRIAAPTPRARAALGYLHANCSSCHHAGGDLDRIGLVLDAPFAPEHVAAFETTANIPSRFRFPTDATSPMRVVPGEPERSILPRRMASRSPLTQMPPLGTHLVDREGLALVEDWIRFDVKPSSGAHPTSPSPAPSSSAQTISSKD